MDYLLESNFECLTSYGVADTPISYLPPPLHISRYQLQGGPLKIPRDQGQKISTIFAASNIWKLRHSRLPQSIKLTGGTDIWRIWSASPPHRKLLNFFHGNMKEFLPLPTHPKKKDLVPGPVLVGKYFLIWSTRRRSLASHRFKWGDTLPPLVIRSVSVWPNPPSQKYLKYIDPPLGLSRNTLNTYTTHLWWGFFHGGFPITKNYPISHQMFYSFFLFFFWSGLQGPKAYSLWGGVVPSPSIG